MDETTPEPSFLPRNDIQTVSGAADDPMATGLPDWLQPFEPEETDVDGASQEATADPSANDAKRAVAIRTVITGRQAEGLPPLKKPRVNLSRRESNSRRRRFVHRLLLDQ